MPLPATFFVPEFLRLDRDELHVLMHQLRDPLAMHLYLLILGHCVFKTGEFLGNYARLIELCTPPQPERGRRRSGPSLKMVRNACDALEAAGMILRSPQNLPQGTLRFWVTKLQKKATPIQKAGRV